MEHVFSSFSDWWVSSWGNITSIIYSQYLWKQSVKPGVKLCSASKIRAQGLRTCAAIVGFANWRFFLSSSFFSSLPSILGLSFSGLPLQIHLVYHGLRWNKKQKEAVTPSLFRSVHFGWITLAVEIIACPNYEFICCCGFQTWCGENSPEQNQTMRGE